jgi:hypothetical protein
MVRWNLATIIIPLCDDFRHARFHLFICLYVSIPISRGRLWNPASVCRLAGMILWFLLICYKLYPLALDENCWENVTAIIFF